MSPSNSRIPTLTLPVDAAKASPLKPKGTPFSVAIDCPVIRVPDGTPDILKAGASGTITQALGSSYSLAVEGKLFRLSGEFGPNISQPIRGLANDYLENLEVSEANITQVLNTIYDPEIPISIVSLGLVYAIDLSETNAININLTLTSPSCGMGNVLIAEIKNKLSKLKTIDKVNVTLVFTPTWGKSLISLEGQLELGLL